MDLHLDTTPARTAAVPFDAEGRYRSVSYWHETVDMTPGPALEGDIDCDVAVIGGGYTGLSVAYNLKRLAPDLDIVLLEKAVVGHGASGRNGGFAMPLTGWDLLYTVRKLGEAAGGAVYCVMYDAVSHVKKLVADHGIACDLEATGYALINTCAARERRARKEYACAHRLGFDHVWLDKAALEEYIRCPRFRSGVFDPHPCVINPAKLARGMKGVVERAGVRVFERTPLEALTAGPRVELCTPKGRVRAPAMGWVSCCM
ncbi:MAG TPA: FAD-dependent oxidoreductase [Candidatus Hydrogenedentes bacterium]|nr:FAD-dependent oxidoreductase [Candidatus Hydrogenedentota bacterium]